MPPRRIRQGDTYEAGEDVELEDVQPDPDPPPEDSRGEPWNWNFEEHPIPPRGWPRAPQAWRDGENFDGSR